MLELTSDERRVMVGVRTTTISKALPLRADEPSLASIPTDDAALDHGHSDLFNANDVVWSKIVQWLRNHDDDNSCSE
jgi:hypothetical protein